MVTSAWYVFGCFWVFRSKTCYDKNPNGFSLALAYCIAFLIFVGIMATYCCYPATRKPLQREDEPLANA